MPYFQFRDPLLSMGRRGPPLKWFSSIRVNGVPEPHCISIVRRTSSSVLLSDPYNPSFQIEYTDDALTLWGEPKRRPLFASLLKEVVSVRLSLESPFAAFFFSPLPSITAPIHIRRSF